MIDKHSEFSFIAKSFRSISVMNYLDLKYENSIFSMLLQNDDDTYSSVIAKILSLCWFLNHSDLLYLLILWKFVLI